MVNQEKPTITIIEQAKNSSKEFTFNKIYKENTTLADIKDCGAIEQDADTVIFLYRPNGNDYESTVEVNALCAKQRQGSLFNESLTYVKEILKFVDPNQSAPITETFVDVSTIPQNKRNDNFIDTPF